MALFKWISGKWGKFRKQMTCAEFEEFVDSYVEGTLPYVTKVRFEMHMGACPMCRSYVAAYQMTKKLGKAVFDREANESVPDDVPQDLIEAILEAKKKSS